MSAEVKFVNAGVLRIAYLEDGVADGWPVVLSHGFPYDVHAYDEVSAACPPQSCSRHLNSSGRVLWSGMHPCW